MADGFEVSAGIAAAVVTANTHGREGESEYERGYRKGARNTAERIQAAIKAAGRPAAAPAEAPSTRWTLEELRAYADRGTVPDRFRIRPAVTPEAITAAVEAERERCVKAVEKATESNNDVPFGWLIRDEALEEIRNG